MTNYKPKSANRLGNDYYSNLKNQFKDQISVLMSEKDAGGRGYFDDEKELSRVNTAYSMVKKRQHPQKINGIIHLVQKDKDEANHEYKNVIAAEKQILDLLRQTDPQRQRKVPRQYRNQRENPQNIQLKQQNYKMNQQMPQKYVDDSKYNLRSGNNQKSAQKSSQRAEDILGDDFTIQDLDFLNGLSKEELIRRLIKALRLYKAEKNRRVWIENELKRLLGLEVLPQNLDFPFNRENAQMQRRPTEKKRDYQSSFKNDQYNNNYGLSGATEYESPRSIPNISRNIDYDAEPVALSSVKKNYDKQRDNKPLRNGSNQQPEDYKKRFVIQEAPISKTYNGYKQQDARISFNPEHQKYFEKKEQNKNNKYPQQVPMKNYNYNSDKKSSDVNSQFQNNSVRRLKTLNSLSGSHPDLLDLWEQGEAIRKETITLIELKRQTSTGQFKKMETFSRKQYQRPTYNESSRKQSNDYIY